MNNIHTALIGGNGVIGKSLLSNMCFDYVYNSSTIMEMSQHEFDLVVCAAPSGNRLAINKGEIDDHKDILQIKNVLDGCKINRLVLISTVDVVTDPDSTYGKNRLELENFVKSKFPCVILRLSTLIGKHIKKNMLFDLVHDRYVDKIVPETTVQWCILDHLPDLIKNSPIGTQMNVVSEPIKNQLVADRFFPTAQLLGKDTPKNYDIKPYIYDQEEIFFAMKEYIG